MEKLSSYTQSIEFESEVSRYIASLDEKIKKEYNPNKKVKYFAFDLYSSEECKNLDWPAKTAVEIKLNLSYNSINRVLQRFTIFLEENVITQLVIIYKEGTPVDSLRKYVESYKHKDKIKIYDFESFKKDFKRPENIDAGKDIANAPIDIIEKAKQDFESHKYTLFLGAGVSMDAKLPGWTQLLEALLKQDRDMPYQNMNESNANAISEIFSNSAIITGRYVFDGYKKSMKASGGSPADPHEVDNIIVERMRKALYKEHEQYQSNLIDSLANTIDNKNPVQVITYNYDDLLETRLNDKEKYVSVFDKHIPRHDIIPIYHVHGMIAREQYEPSLPVLSEREYHKLYYDLYNWANIVQLHALNTTTCFFIGFSMTDPNQRRLLELARDEDINSGNEDKLHHYVFLRQAPLKGEASMQVNKEHWLEMEYMMSDFGLNVIWYKEYAQLPQLIEYIAGVSANKPVIE